MGYKKCPKCELNTIREDEELCSVCSSEYSIVRKVDRQDKKTVKYARKRKNIAFKCNYCDGAVAQNAIGFAGVCSKELLIANVRKGNSWCGVEDCVCCRYVEGLLDREQLLKKYNEGEQICYESQLLVNWKMFAGMDATGKNKGRPRRIDGASTNSLCVLTLLDNSAAVKTKYIFGVFIVNSVDEGNDVKEGFVTADNKYRISLTLDEAYQMPFNKYYATDWKQGLFRYFDDETAITILKDIVSIKQGKDKKLAEEILNRFVTVNSLQI